MHVAPLLVSCIAVPDKMMFNQLQPLSLGVACKAWVYVRGLQPQILIKRPYSSHLLLQATTVSSSCPGNEFS